MHSDSSRTPPMIARTADGSAGAVGMRPAAPLNGSAESPAPGDEAALHEFRRSIDAGIAEAHAGVGDDWRTVQARMRARFPLPPR